MFESDVTWTEGEQGPIGVARDNPGPRLRYEGEGLVHRCPNGSWRLMYCPPRTSIFYSIALPAFKPPHLPKDPQKWIPFLIEWGRDNEPTHNWYKEWKSEFVTRGTSDRIYAPYWGRLVHLFEPNPLKRAWIRFVQAIKHSRRMK